MSQENDFENEIEDSEEENTQINEEYKIWKRNTPFLYDLVLTHALEWPSLTVQWLPVKENFPDKEYTRQKIILGTHTSNQEQNYLILANIYLPKESTPIDVRKYEQLNPNSEGGFGGGKIEIFQRINHDGEVNRARYMPQNYSMIATKPPNGEIYIFDYQKMRSDPSPNGKCSPLIKLKGHTQEGYGLSWNEKEKGLIASGSYDKTVCVWNIGSNSTDPILKIEQHTDVVNDVCWHKHSSNILASVSDDKTLRIWDTKSPSKPLINVEAHTKASNCVDFSPFNENLLVTGGSDHTVKLWDIRNMKTELHSMYSHENSVFGVQWNPHNETIIASMSEDRKVMVWDLSKIGDQQSKEDQEDGPPELLFVHGGHTTNVSDISWNPNEGGSFTMASSADDNILQIWEIAGSVYSEFEDVPDEELE